LSALTCMRVDESEKFCHVDTVYTILTLFPQQRNQWRMHRGY